MPITLFESGAGERERERRERLLSSILEGVVVNPCDPRRQGKLKVRIPALSEEVWARLSAPGGGSGAGLFYTPRVDDEVLVGFGGGNIENAYILGGLWNSMDSPPVSMNPVDVVSKRVLKTGLADGIGHEIEFDDGIGQSITITTSGVTPVERQQITMSPTGIELKNMAGSLTIKMDNSSQSISIQAVAKLELKATQISIEGAQVQVKGGNISLQSAGPCSIQGLPVKIN
jgi:uncharacterized protein involved in type VI secretion and phage assembly